MLSQQATLLTWKKIMRLRKPQEENQSQLEDNTYAGVGTPNGVDHISASSEEKNVQEEVIELHLSLKNLDLRGLLVMKQ